jgi:hypothetical protein
MDFEKAKRNDLTKHKVHENPCPLHPASCILSSMHPLSQKIATLEHRLKLRRLAIAGCWTTATIITAALALGLADYILRYRDPGLRIMETATFALAGMWAVYRWWYKPGRQRLDSLTVARRIESHFPQLNDSLASATEFLRQSEDDPTAGSAQLRRLVVAEAQTTVEGLPLDEIIDRRPLRRAAMWFTIASLALLFCLLWNAPAVGTALARLAAPMGSTQWPRQNHLAFRDPPTRLAAGQTFEAELIDTAGELPDDVRIEYRMAHGNRRENSSEPMKRAGDVMVARRENVRQSFAFRAVGGDDDMMRWHWVEVVEAPQLKTLTITTHPPAYTGLPDTDSDRHLDVLAGTSIELSGTATKALSAARVLIEGEPPIEATISADVDGNAARAIRIDPQKWIATKSGQYSVELAGDDGLAGAAGRWNLRVEPDSPPSVSWQRPDGDLYVTNVAAVPIELIVKDNLAIRSVELTYERSDWSESERERRRPAARIELFRGADTVLPRPATTNGRRGDSRVIEYTWDLAPLELPVGAEIAIAAEAADFRPGTGRTASPRRITIITADELNARLADRQTQIVRQLERALAIEQPTREEVRRVEIQLEAAGVLTAGDQNALQSAELNQRRVSRILIDPAEGVPALITAVESELEMNRVASSEMRETMERLAAELQRLADGPLNIADRELTAGRKSLDAADSERVADLSASLFAAGAAQEDVIQTLERIIREISGKVDYGRFARLLIELRLDQLAHEQATRKEIDVETLPLRVSELTRAQKATLQKAVAGQSAIAARYEKIERGMDLAARELSEGKAEVAEVLIDAVDLARGLAIAAKMDENAADLGENRVSSALARETQVAADLQQVIDALRGNHERQTEQIANQLRNAEQQLQRLQRQLADLRQQIAQAEQATSRATSQELQSLNDKEQELRDEIEKLARQLDRIDASDASQSTQRAAGRLHKRPQNEHDSPQTAGRPSSTTEVQKAEQDLDEAAQQLAQRRQQVEDDLALEIVRRFQQQLTDMVQRQRIVIDATVKLHASRGQDDPLPAADAEKTTNLANEERELAEMAKEHSELLVGLGAVRVSLEEAERRLAAAAKLLDDRHTGPIAQRAEQHALARLEGMMEAFSQTASEAAPNPDAQPGAGAGAQPNQPQRRPTFELLEVKMLRMLQIELQLRTQEYEQRIAAQKTPPHGVQPADLQKEAQELAAEQRRLAELVQTMLNRDNEQEQ